MTDNPILNSPYEEPALHYAQTEDGSLNYEAVVKGRRVFNPIVERQPTPTRQSRQRSIAFPMEPDINAEQHLINLCRKEVRKWRGEKYPDTTRVSKELLCFWFANPERENRFKLFFAQQEAVETAVWLNEVAEKSNAGQNILRQIRDAQTAVSESHEDQLPRTAFKMATGSGKTVVMACLILYHYANRREYRSDTRFADYFLLVAPGVTIKDRLGVLFVDTRNVPEHELEDYYRVRQLVPKNLKDGLSNLNARLVITNYHAFLPKTLQGNKKSPFDGKVDLEGNKIKRPDSIEDFSIVIRRVLGSFKTGSRLLVLNDEAHHCYLPKGKQKTTDNEEVDENERAAVWFKGLREVAQKYKVHNIYDLSATPYYLSGSGYEPYSLFPWVVSDFGLIEAIESGLVKIPFLPETDTTHELERSVLSNIYEHVRDDLPRKGQKKRKKEAREEGEQLKQERPIIPTLIKQALDMFYNHYDEYANGQRGQQEVRRGLFTPDPVFIIVCNNTSVSKEVYKYVAGYEYVDNDGEIHVVGGIKDHFNNYDSNNKPKRKPPTLLIDSDALDNSDQINEDFKKVFADEIEIFKRDYTRIHGQGSAENITDAQILREVVNTVGQQGKLGEHIRCVVSVSMLTEGWDANTVTHIMGIRAFGSQLLCEQVAGRALRRMNYDLQAYDKTGEPTDDKRKAVSWKFPPEYAHIIGVPFKLFKGGKAGHAPAPLDRMQIKALPERAALEITFPNIIGYRLENAANEITSDFSKVENYDIDGTKYPVEATMAIAVSPRQETLKVKDVLDRRDAELQYLITKELIRYKFSDVDGNPEFRYFGRLREIVDEWYGQKVRLLGIRGDEYKKLLFFHDAKKIVDHIARGINTHLNTSEFVRPVFNHYNRFGSTKYVSGYTSKRTFETTRSHVNHVVEDSGWEGIATKTLEELNVISYVKNNFLDFRIPYVREAQERDYFPDFIVRVNGKDGTPKNLILEISGMSKDKAEKIWYVENRWIPAVNSVRERFGYDEWHFVEVRDDIKDIKNELIDKIQSI